MQGHCGSNEGVLFHPKYNGKPLKHSTCGLVCVKLGDGDRERINCVNQFNKGHPSSCMEKTSKWARERRQIVLLGGH